MSYGLALRNPSSELIIDGDHSNYVEWTSGSVALTTSFPNTPANFPATVSRLPLIFVQCTSPVYISEVLGSGSSLTGVRFGTFVGTLLPNWPSGFAATCYYRMFMPASFLGESSESHGLRVYSDTGGLVYDSGRTAMQPSYYGSYTRPSNWPTGLIGVEQTFSVSGFSSTPWVCVNPYCGPVKFMVGAPIQGYSEGVRAIDASTLGYMVGRTYAQAGSDPGTRLVAPSVALPLIAIP